DVPLARRVHQEGVLLDKAAVLHYTRIASRDGKWINCECCFTVVHDVLVASTSIYRGGLKSERRKVDAPQIERIFSSAPRDPRYHMLEHMSPKFTMPPAGREPRAALILNRFTRNLSIMFATNAVEAILGISPEEIKDKPFYECIQENCLQEAIQVLESAKANESIAYLRFWFRDPRIGTDGENEDEEEDEDEDEEDSDEENDEDDDEVEYLGSRAKGSKGKVVRQDDDQMDIDDKPSGLGDGRGEARERDRDRRPSSFELEAVVSCTSDGLVVVLRRARPQAPEHVPQPVPVFTYKNGLFAAPWGLRPIEPSVPPELIHIFRPPLLPQHMPLKEKVRAAGGPPMDQLMRSIRDVAVFAWALVGINGNIANYAHGFPPRDDAHSPAADGRYPGRGDSRALNQHLENCRLYYNPNNGGRSLAAAARPPSPLEYSPGQQALPGGSGSGSGCTCRGAGAGPASAQRQHTPGAYPYAPQAQQHGFDSRPEYRSQSGGVFCRGALQQPSEEPGSPVPSASSASSILQHQQQHYHHTPPPPLPHHHHPSPSPMLSPLQAATPESEYAPALTPARHGLPPEPWTVEAATATASTSTQAGAPDGNEMRRNSRLLWQ
ncbi:hypothetical protein QBC32DRAFT_218116, partial [Pseudoneurospora amorphoporcata]